MIETHPRYIRDIWSAPTPDGLKKGDYVLATKYRDGDPNDHFVVGVYDRSINNGIETRHMIVDSEGKQFRANGFRRVAKLGTKRGAWIVGHLTLIERERNRLSVWHWYRAAWRELNGHVSDRNAVSEYQQTKQEPR